MAHVPYASVVSSIMYVMVCTWPYTAHAVGVLRRFMSTPGKENSTNVKRVFRYLCGIKDYFICYQGKHGGYSELDVHGFVGIDWAGDSDRRRSTNGYVLNMFIGEIRWMSKQ